MKSNLGYEELMELLSECQIGAVLLSDKLKIIALNQEGNRLLHGKGKLIGQTAPESVLALYEHTESDYYIRVTFREYIARHQVPEPADLPAGSVFIGFRDAHDDFRSEMMKAILNKISEGVVVCDDHDRLLYYNDAAAKTDSIVMENVRGKRVQDVYIMTDGSEILLPKTLKERAPVLNHRQKYTTIDGKKKDVVANVWPVIVKGNLLGAFNVVEDWSQVDELHRQIIDLQEKLVQYGEKYNRNKSALTAKYTFDDILYKSDAMDRVVEQCRQVARTDSSVMIYGETGTGKELFAQSIHNASNRANGPFLAINCAALPENLLESLLFGSVKGAYTGAENRSGLFEQANHGTLLLDEINSMNISLQAKLLRVLQEGRIRKVGGSQEIPVDVRVLSNINVPPHEAIANNHLRQDLYYRLGVINITIPSLRERPEDISILVNYFIQENNQKLQRSVRGVAAEVLAMAQNYSWPGNVRELQHAVEHAMIIMPEHAELLTMEYTPQYLSKEEAFYVEDRVAAVSEKAGTKNLNRQLMGLEEDIIVRTLKENDGNITKSARLLNMSRQNLQYRIKKYRINIEGFKK